MEDEGDGTASACPFCRIVRGEAPALVVAVNDATLAFLDHRPLLPGHCLLVPKAHHETLPDLPPALVAPLFAAAQRLAGAVEAALGADGSFVAINNRVSQSVPHLHVHVVPRRRKDGLFARNFVWARRPYPDAAAAARVRDAIRAALADPSRRRSSGGDGGPIEHRPGRRDPQPSSPPGRKIGEAGRRAMR